MMDLVKNSCTLEKRYKSLTNPFTLCESDCERDVASKWIIRKYTLLFTLSSGKDQRKSSHAYVFSFVQCRCTFIFCASPPVLKTYSHRTKEEATAKIFFDACRLIFELLCLFLDLFRFRSCFRSVWTGPYVVPNKTYFHSLFQYWSVYTDRRILARRSGKLRDSDMGYSRRNLELFSKIREKHFYLVGSYKRFVNLVTLFKYRRLSLFFLFLSADSFCVFLFIP